MLLGAVLMLVLSIALAWLPLAGPLIAGIVGGYYAGTVGRALAAAVLPAFLLGAFVWWVAAAGNHAFAGFLLGLGVFMLVAVHEFGLLVGAVVGGLIGHRRKRSSPVVARQ